MSAILDAKIPSGPINEKWTDFKSHVPLVNPANKRNIEVIVVGTGLNYQNDGDSVFRLFYDTIKGGDYRAREGNVHRLAEVSGSIIDQCVAQGVPFAREYGGLLSNRSFGGTQVQRTFYAAGQTGQQLLLGAYSALQRQIGLGNVTMMTRHEMMDVVMIDGKARGIIARDLISGKLERHFGHAVLLCTGGYGNVFYLSTNAMGSNVSATWKAHRKGAFFANPCYTQIHPTCIPVSGDHQSKLTLMSESLRNDGRIWVPKKQNDTRLSIDIPEEERDYYLERRYPEHPKWQYIWIFPKLFYVTEKEKLINKAFTMQHPSNCKKWVWVS